MFDPMRVVDDFKAGKTFGQERVDPLDYMDQMNKAAKPVTIEQAHEWVKQARDSAARMIAKALPGFKIKRWTLANQLRQYKSMFESDGRTRNVYYITISKE